MFLEETEISNYADAITIYVCGSEIKAIPKDLESDALKITELFPNSFIKLNEDKCHLMNFGEQ